jgi:hypothetical protein
MQTATIYKQLNKRGDGWKYWQCVDGAKVRLSWQRAISMRRKAEAEIVQLPGRDGEAARAD